MAKTDKLQERVENILSGRGKGSMMSAAEEATPQQAQFSPFVNEDLERARDIASELMDIANKKGGEAGLSEAVSEVEQRLGEEKPGLLQYAVKLFVTHHPEARERFRLKPLEKRQPNIVRPSKAKPQATAEEAEAEDTEAEAAPTTGATPPEDKISFWREDPLINEHHEHWHLVYPTSGRPRPGGGFDIGDRHGELFAYMHEQMIARYDAERLAAGLGPVKPFDKYSETIPQGYDPGDLQLWADGGWSPFGPRPAGATWSDLTAPFDTRPGATIKEQQSFTKKLLASDTSGSYTIKGKKRAVTADNLGATVEASVMSVDYYGSGNAKNFQTYGNLHNDGHIHSMAFNNQQPYGVMGYTSTAIRDPIFFRWHKQVDNVFFTWQENQKPNNFAKGPEAKVHDIILCPKGGLHAGFNGVKVGDEAFGYPQNWEHDFSATTLKLSSGEKVTTTAELLTEMLSRTVNVEDAQGGTVQETVSYLSHDDFYYFLRLQNLSDKPQRVTVRIFMAPETEVENRRSWIEMDRFLYSFKASEHAVVFRPADQSSVVRKPALKPEDLTPDDEPGPKTDLQAWCDCGWPYTVLLPRGTKEGMEFRLLVMLSGGDDLSVPDHPEHCTSISYCGLQDKDYPDKQLMGYPFDRPFEMPISKTITKYDNWGSRTIKIRCRNLK